MRNGQLMVYAVQNKLRGLEGHRAEEREAETALQDPGEVGRRW
jgi:hypothetical protein